MNYDIKVEFTIICLKKGQGSTKMVEIQILNI